MAENFNVEDFINVESPVKEEKVKFKRFKVPFEIRSLTAKEVSELRNDSKEVQFNKSTRTSQKVLNQDKFENNLMAASVVVPNLKNEELQKHYGTYGDPAGTLEAMLLAGEYNVLAEKVLELSGIDANNDNDLVAEAKN